MALSRIKLFRGDALDKVVESFIGWADLSGGGSGPQQVTVEVSSAEILALADTPVVLVPGVPGKVISLVGATFVYFAGATPYTLANPSSGLNLYTDTAFAEWGNVGAAGLIDQPADAAALPNALSPGTGGSLTDFAGQPIIMEASFGNPTLGDGTLKVTLAYFLADAA